MGGVVPLPKAAKTGPAAIPKPHTTRKIARTLLFIGVLLLACISYYDFLPLNAIPKIASRIPDRLVGLGRAFFISSTHRQRITPRRPCGPRCFPRPEAVRAMVFSEFCRRPVFSSIIRNFHSVDAGKPAESDTAQRDVHSRGDFARSIEGDEERPHRKPLDGDRFYFSCLDILEWCSRVACP